ncbi:MAG: O-methyltransferase [Candidatus Cyclobacteriaceae bacterium M3_2C_046]
MKVQHLKMAVRYFKYFLKAIDEYSLHAPFIYEVYTALIKNDQQQDDLEVFKQVKQQLLQDKTLLEVTDLGAGSIYFNQARRPVKKVTRHSLSSEKQSRLLHRLIARYQPETIIELGTSLGLNTLYMASGNPGGKTFTLEGCPNTATMAMSLFKNFPQYNIHLIKGNIDQTFPTLLKQIDQADFIYFDANHSYQATVNYFNQALAKVNNNTIFAIGDIHWSDSMEKAWAEISMHPRVTLSIDLFQSGLLFFRPLYLKQHYILEY